MKIRDVTNLPAIDATLLQSKKTRVIHKQVVKAKRLQKIGIPAFSSHISGISIIARPGDHTLTIQNCVVGSNGWKLAHVNATSNSEPESPKPQASRIAFALAEFLKLIPAIGLVTPSGKAFRKRKKVENRVTIMDSI